MQNFRQFRQKLGPWRKKSVNRTEISRNTRNVRNGPKMNVRNGPHTQGRPVAFVFNCTIFLVKDLHSTCFFSINSTSTMILIIYQGGRDFMSSLHATFWFTPVCSFYTWIRTPRAGPACAGRSSRSFSGRFSRFRYFVIFQFNSPFFFATGPIFDEIVWNFAGK